ncbi:serine protease [Prauserella sp. PE36]|nr:serine protease [Prauserella sp. PE36]
MMCFLLASRDPSGFRPLGTGFALGGRQVATALHVVGPEAGNIHAVLRRSEVAGYQDTTDRLVKLPFPLELVHADPIHDLAVLEFPDQVEARVPYKVTGTDHVDTGTSVVTYGFPHANDGRVVLTQQAASVGAKVLMENQGIKNKYIVLNTLLRPGQSGGPVFDVKTGNIVAVLVGAYVPPGGGGGILIGNVDPMTLHQTTHAVSAEYIQDMLE